MDEESSTSSTYTDSSEENEEGNEYHSPIAGWLAGVRPLRKPSGMEVCALLVLISLLLAPVILSVTLI